MDITKCEGKWCPLKEKCYRYTSPSDFHQSYFVEIPYDKENNNCEYFYK